MKKLIFLTFFCITNAAASEPIVPASVLDSWGYEITDSTQSSLSIKRIEGEPAGEGLKYYPRFILSKSCYGSNELVLEKQKSISEEHASDAFGGFKRHHNSFVSNNCLYGIETAARTTYLSYQAQILKKFESYIINANKP